MKSLLVLGGARSGKSRYAQQRIETLPGNLAYIATAQSLDEEMADRISRHKADRSERWTTLEAPFALSEAIGRAAGNFDAILVDCLTLWLSNCLLAGKDLEIAAQSLEAAVTACAVPIILVSNEVGLGIVPENALARRFRDEAGRLNQGMAAVVDEAVFVAAGLPLLLKQGIATD